MAPRLIAASRSQTLKEQRGWACVSVCITLLPDFVTNKYCLVRGSAAERKKKNREGAGGGEGRRERGEKGGGRREGENFDIKVDQGLGVCLKIF